MAGGGGRGGAGSRGKGSGGLPPGFQPPRLMMRGWVNPSRWGPSKRHPVRRANPLITYHRLRFIRYRLRPLLWGCFPEEAPREGLLPHPEWKDFALREMEMAWKLRRFTDRGGFKYADMVRVAREYVGLRGKVQNLDTERAYFDEFWDWMKTVREREGRARYYHDWHRENRDPYIRQKAAEHRARELMLMGVCPLCGGKLPCMEDAIPKVRRGSGWNGLDIVTGA